MGNMWEGGSQGGDQHITIDFSYKIDNKDTTDFGGKAGDQSRKDNFQNDRKNNQLKKSFNYARDAELELGFPEDKQEYESFPWLEDVAGNRNKRS